MCNTKVPLQHLNTSGRTYESFDENLSQFTSKFINVYKWTRKAGERTCTYPDIKYCNFDVKVSMSCHSFVSLHLSKIKACFICN